MTGRQWFETVVAVYALAAATIVVQILVERHLARHHDRPLPPAPPGVEAGCPALGDRRAATQGRDDTDPVWADFERTARR